MSSFAPTKHSRAAELAAHDAVCRAAEAVREDAERMLLERGFDPEHFEHVKDKRHLRDPAPVPTLVHSAAFLEHKEAHKNKNRRADYLRPDVPILAEQSSGQKKEQQRSRKALAPPQPTAAEAQAAVHARTKLLIASTQRELVERARHLAARYDELGVFSTATNRVRAATVCRLELRRSVSVESLRQRAEELVQSGCEPRSEAAEAVSSGAVGLLTASERLRGRLELLHEQMQQRGRSRGGASTAPGGSRTKAHGLSSQQSMRRCGSVGRNLPSSASVRTDSQRYDDGARGMLAPAASLTQHRPATRHSHLSSAGSSRVSFAGGERSEQRASGGGALGTGSNAHAAAPLRPIPSNATAGTGAAATPPVGLTRPAASGTRGGSAVPVGADLRSSQSMPHVRMGRA